MTMSKSIHLHLGESKRRFHYPVRSKLSNTSFKVRYVPSRKITTWEKKYRKVKAMEKIQCIGKKKKKKILVDAGKGTKISLNSTGAIFQMKRFLFSMG